MYKISNRSQSIYSAQVIISAFKHLMTFETFEEITITQLCQYAEVSRPTFYRHFTTKEDVVELYLHQIYEDVFNKHKPQSIMHEVLMVYYGVVLGYKDILTFIQNNHLDYLLKVSISDILSKFPITNTIQSQPIDNEFLIDFISSTVCSVLLLWTKHQFKESIDEITHITELFLKDISISKEPTYE